MNYLALNYAESDKKYTETEEILKKIEELQRK